MSIYFDNRWIGSHGIGRFAGEVAFRCDFTPAIFSGKPLDFFDPWRMRQTLLKKKPCHFFSPGFNAPFGAPCSFSLTIHDLIHLDFSDESSLVKRLYYKIIVLPAVHHADMVFTVSEYSRQKIAEWSGIDPDRIVVAGNGVSANFSPDGSRWKWNKPYLLYVGSQKPHKNVEGLIRAFAESSLTKDVDLLLTGEMSESVARVVTEYRVTDHVKSLGLIPEADLPNLYRGAMAVVMPSWYEGFGLPLVEAMACGTPVLSSNRTSLPEIGGEAAAYFEPESQESFVQGLHFVCDQSNREGMRLAGLLRAKDFCWEAVAKRVSDSINDCTGKDSAKSHS